jgi:hypothetical protein
MVMEIILGYLKKENNFSKVDIKTFKNSRKI